MTATAEPTHAKMAQPFLHSPLFRSLEKGQQKKLKLDVTYEVGVASFRFWGPEPLGVTDLRVLQGLVAMTTSQLPIEGGVSRLLRDGRMQRKGLKMAGDALLQDTVAARFRLTTFAQAIGYVRPGQSTLARLREAIVRLSAVTVLSRQPCFSGSYHILSGYFEDTNTGEVVVGLNPVLTAAVLGKNEFLRVDLSEVRRLKSDAARLIHSRLHWINQGAIRKVNMETLCGYIYANTPATPSGLANRKVAVRKAIAELRGLGWDATEYKTGSFTIRRPIIKRKARSKGEGDYGHSMNSPRSNDEASGDLYSA